MRTIGNVSKVAVCPNCNGIILACHVDSLEEETEKEFTELTNEGFEVKLETIDETRKKRFGTYNECSKQECLKPTIKD